MARMISTASPSRTVVVGQAARRTTAPLSEIAKPRGSAISSVGGLVAPQLGEIGRLAVARLSVDGELHVRHSACVFRFAVADLAAKSIEPERLRHRRHVAVGDQRLDGERRRGRQQVAVAMMTGGDRKARDRRRAEDRRVVDRAWPEPGPHRLDRHLLDGRKGAARAFQQRIKAARRDGIVEAAFLDGGADDQPAVALGRPCASARSTRYGRAFRCPPSMCSASAWPLSGRTGTTEARRQGCPRSMRRPRARRSAPDSRPPPSPVRQTRPPCEVERIDRAMFDQAAAGRQEGARATPPSPAADRPGGRRRSNSPAATEGRSAGSMSRTSGPPSQRVGRPQRLWRSWRKRSRSTSSRPSATTRVPPSRKSMSWPDCASSARAELRPFALAFEREREQIGIARLVLRRRRQHAGGRKARAGADGGALEHRDRQAAQREPPRDRQADDAGPDHGDIDGGRNRGRPVRSRRRRRRSVRIVPINTGCGPGEPASQKPPLSVMDRKTLSSKSPLPQWWSAISNPYAGANRVRFKGFPRCRSASGFSAPCRGSPLERRQISANRRAGSSGAETQRDAAKRGSGLRKTLGIGGSCCTAAPTFENRKPRHQAYSNPPRFCVERLACDSGVAGPRGDEVEQ